MIRRRPLLLWLVAVVLLGAAAASARGVLAPPTAQSLAEDVTVLAAPEMEGRRSGTPGGDRAARRIAQWLEAAGLRPAGDHGTYFQPFVVDTAVSLGTASALEVLGTAPRRFEVGREWAPHGGSLSGDVTGEIVFAGHGGSGAYGSRDDWAGLDVRGKIALVLDGPADGSRVTRLEKLLAAKRHGAAALLLVGDALPLLDATAAGVGLVSATITREAAAAFVPGARARLAVDLGREERRGVNVVGILPGTDPALAAEAVVIGAHYDHLGRLGGVAHPGADDNASGTALVVGLARAFAAGGGVPRTLVFALFGGEELGLLGSSHYVRQPAVPLARTVAMVNFDMVGRIREDRLIVSGVDSGSGLRDVVAAAARLGTAALDVEGTPYGPSDHTRFYEAGVPVLFFTTGGHGDHHQPTDTADRIDAAGMARSAGVALRALERLAGDARPAWVKVAPPAPRGRAQGSASGIAFLGTLIDPQTVGDGLRVSAPLPGSPAEHAGFRKGDVIIRFAGVAVESLEALRREVQARKPGESVKILYLRDDEAHEATTTLGVRP